MSFSVGVLYSSQRLLELVGIGGLKLEDFQGAFRTFEVASARAVLSLCQECRWVAIDAEGSLCVTEAGDVILGLAGPEARLRVQLKEMISHLDPPWCRRIPHGRAEVMRFMPTDVTQIFKECGLLDDWTDKVVDWWDELALSIRSRRTDANLKVGRSAERLSIAYESARTKSPPKWQSLESNFSGFDILSVKTAEDHTPLKIEVKGTTLPQREAFFVVTRNEWEVATAQGEYCFHFWRVHTNVRNPIVVPSMAMAGHIAKDLGDGRWEQIRIPFATFR